jgi:hypothetical protein
MITIRRALIMLLAIGALLVLPVSAAAASKTTVIVSLKFPAFHGKVTSPRKACIAGRKVKMFRERNGKKVLLGRDRSNHKGKWSIPIGKKLTSGSYYAVVTKTGKCSGDKSTVLPVD